jgi:hypothetical protein
MGDSKVDDTSAAGGIFQILIACGGYTAGDRDLRGDAVRYRRIEAAPVQRHPRVMDDNSTAGAPSSRA